MTAEIEELRALRQRVIELVGEVDPSIPVFARQSRSEVDRGVITLKDLVRLLELVASTARVGR